MIAVINSHRRHTPISMRLRRISPEQHMKYQSCFHICDYRWYAVSRGRFPFHWNVKQTRTLNAHASNGPLGRIKIYAVRSTDGTKARYSFVICCNLISHVVNIIHGSCCHTFESIQHFCFLNGSSYASNFTEIPSECFPAKKAFSASGKSKD